VKFFVDNCLPPRMARAFNEIGKPDHSFIHLREHPRLKPTSSDIAWIKLLAEEGNWIILTKDKNIMKKPIEKAAFAKAKLTGFFLDNTWSKFDFWMQLSKLAAIMPKIIELAETSPHGVCYKVPIKSKDIQKI
jgi:hypothetical protein